MLRRRTNARAECARDGAVMSVHAQCPFIGPDSGKWADMKHLPEEIAKDRQEIARFVPKSIRFYYY